MPVDQTSILKLPIINEAARLMTICNACRYCEGHCAVFPAMERRLIFDEATIDYLSNLCHQCGACYQHCQYAAPHEFNVNVPLVFAKARNESYVTHAWPGAMKWMFRANGLFAFAGFLLFTLLFVAATIHRTGFDGLFTMHAGGFYSFIPHQIMAGVFGMAGLIVLIVWFFSTRNFWQALILPAPWTIPRRVYVRSLGDALTLKNLGGGHGRGCYETSDQPSPTKRRFHHLTMYGFLLCFIATCLGTFYHYGLALPAPYGWFTAPKIFGMAGGLSLLAGSIGLLWHKYSTLSDLQHNDQGFGDTLTWLLIITSATGLALPFLKSSPMLAMMLCIHLASVLCLFLNFAWGKFLHSIYRLLALIADALEKERGLVADQGAYFDG